MHSLILPFINICGLRDPGSNIPTDLVYYRGCTYINPWPPVTQFTGWKGQKNYETYGTFPPLRSNWTRTDIGNWARAIGENHIFLDPTLMPPPSLRDKNPYGTIEKGAFLPPPSSPGSYLLSFSKDFACLLPVCLQSSFFDSCEQEPRFRYHLSDITFC